MAAPSRKLFGTDGVRGVAGEQVTAELALALTRAATKRPEPQPRSSTRSPGRASPSSSARRRSQAHGSGSAGASSQKLSEYARTAREASVLSRKFDGTAVDAGSCLPVHGIRKHAGGT